MKTLRIFLQFLFVVVNIIVVVLFVLAAYSSRFSPEKNLFFSYLGLGFPVLCVLNILFILYWLFQWEWKFILIGLISFLICWNPVKNYFPFHSKVNPVPQESVLKVLTYNVMGFGYKNHTKLSPNKIIEYIVNSDADIVCLQEYAEHKSEKYLTREKIFNALSMYPYRSIFILSNTKFMSYGIAVFSKYPISDSRRIKYESSFNGSSVHQIKVKDKNITLINNHLESFKLTSEDRSRYSAFIKNMGSDTFDELRGAIQQKLGPAFVIRAKQANIVAEEVKNAKNDYVLVCGDFNDTPISYAHHTIQGPLVDAFSESGWGMGISYNQNFFLFRIDNILHSTNMKAINCTVDNVRYSDHYPMWCYLQLDK
ncbi:endonuclease/exonuclease/phosphatase family protein [Parabacteroides bouchesdurhonensis]|uniref:endonuclease/exonuclease/phosphatase family protein n=1 Tax=Parabacteroides bouchesdurhonensis TaxID=1936995 RepID=UPI000E4DAD84|nr:endonuclease/exonuclease/phosphatase family protein [Parabacteroides bouchesdurhonensis]RHJ93092.1 endonuclease [Bacteroides sp. AM07-16]